MVVVDDFFFYDERIVISLVLRLEVLDCIYRGYFGISKCRVRVRMLVWWLGFFVVIEDMVKVCFICLKEFLEFKEFLMSSFFFSCFWERISMDLFEYGGRIYFIIVDYYFRWVEIKRFII